MKLFGENLRALRGQESQASFAKKLGLGQVTYCRYEVGNREPDLETLVGICRTLGVSADEMLGLAPPSRPKIEAVVSGNGNVVIGNNNTVGVPDAPKRGRPKKNA